MSFHILAPARACCVGAGGRGLLREKRGYDVFSRGAAPLAWSRLLQSIAEDFRRPRHAGCGVRIGSLFVFWLLSFGVGELLAQRLQALNVAHVQPLPCEVLATDLPVAHRRAQ